LGRELDLAAQFHVYALKIKRGTLAPSTGNSQPAAQGPDRKKVGLASSKG
jgi:hypothetical protein